MCNITATLYFGVFMSIVMKIAVGYCMFVSLLILYFMALDFYHTTSLGNRRGRGY